MSIPLHVNVSAGIYKYGSEYETGGGGGGSKFTSYLEWDSKNQFQYGGQCRGGTEQ